MTNSASEFDLIARYFAPLAGEGAFGLKDDAAIVPQCAGHDVVVTTDTVVAGVDFFEDDPADTVAKKALRVNLSDLAAKGAEPVAYLLSLSLPRVDEAWLEEFARGLREDQTAYGVSLLGGDTGRGPLSISITAFGHVPSGRMVRRSGARPGDLVFVTGTIGDSGGGLALLKAPEASVSAETRSRLVARYRVPQPPVSFAHAIRAASAAIDVSDGLFADLGHIAHASGVRIAVEAERIPRSPALRALWGDSLEAIVRAATAGDDYQIAFAALASIVDAHTPVTCIGRVEEGAGVVLLDARGRAVEVGGPGFTHF